MTWAPASNAPPSIGINALSFTQTDMNIATLSTPARGVTSGSFLFAVAAKGNIAKLATPTDSKGNSYSPLLAAHNYINWQGSGTRIYAASNVAGDAALITVESMLDLPNDEATLSIFEVIGGSAITNALVAEAASPGPAVSATATVAKRAVLACWWWGDGAVVQAVATPSAGWTKVHEMTNPPNATGVIQVALAVRLVTDAGGYNCTWTADDGMGGAGTQGGVTYITSVEGP